MAHRVGHIVWREVITPDLAATAQFYGDVVGWQGQAMAMPDGSAYTLIACGESPVGGFLQRQEGMGPPCWIAYVSVDDVDAAAVRAITAGGQVLAGPMDAGGIGRTAVVADPQGAIFSLWRANEGDGPAPEGFPVGSFCWESLMTTDPKGAAAFYAAVLGWTEGEFGGGPVFKVGEESVADVQEAPPGVPSHWMSHVVVADVAAARRKAVAGGAAVMLEEMTVPTVGTFSVIADPHGCVISLFQPEAP